MNAIAHVRLVGAAARATGLVVALCSAATAVSADTVRILYSASLNGNLEGCTCKVQPVSGLVKRGAFIEEYRRKNGDVILVDTGDLIADARRTKLAAAIFRAYRLLRYDAVMPGDQDLALGAGQLQRWAGALPLVAANLMRRRALFLSDTALFAPSRVLQRGSRRIRITGILSEGSLRFLPPKHRSILRTTEPLAALKDIPSDDLLIVLSHQGSAADRRLFSKLGRPALVFGGHDQVLIPQPQRLGNGVTYFQPGRDGDRLGEVIVEVSGGGGYRIVGHRQHTFDYGRSPDHPQIRKLIEGLNAH